MDEPLESVPCLLCGKHDARAVARGEGRAQLVRCRNDGLVYLSPRPAAPLLREFHTRFVRQNNLPLFDGHRRDILRREAEVVNRLVPAGGNLLDVGCATGTLFDFFPTHSWQLFGVDTSGLGVAHARAHGGAAVFCGALQEAQFPSGFFDAVTILDTLYYVPDPASELREVHRLLKDDGLLAVEIPGLTYTWLRMQRPVRWLLDGKTNGGLAHSRHLYYFSPKTIRLLLEAAGFRVLQMLPEQASLGGGRARRMMNDLHFRTAQAVHGATRGRISIAGKELYLARKAASRCVFRDASRANAFLSRGAGGETPAFRLMSIGDSR